ncbi:MAG: hypothetical protein K2K46_05950 [Lachnospiraceae bacterium]|nr:hypothetical protein [Lachnospiraceae bacterium]
MSKLASKLNKRIMATVLSVAMVMSNMTVYASELTGPKVENTTDETAVDTEDSSVTPDDAATSGDETPAGETVDDTTGTTVEDPAGEVTDGDEQTPVTGGDEVTDPDDKEGNEDASLEDNEEVKEEEEIEDAEPDKAIEADEQNVDYDVNYSANNKVDVWDFGGAALKDKDGNDRTDVNNMLTTEIIATLKADLADSGKTEAKIEVVTDDTPGSETKDTFTIVKAETTTVIDIAGSKEIPASENDPYAVASSKYTGTLDIPAGDSYITLSAKEGDIFTIVAYSETAPEVILTKVTDSNEPEQPEEPAPSENITTLAGETTHIIRLSASDADGTDSVTYKISSDSALNIARIYRSKDVVVGGTISFEDSEGTPLTGADETAALAELGTITFVPAEDSGEATVTAKVTDKTYTAALVKGTTYKMVVSNKEDYGSIAANGINLDSVTLSADKTDADITVTEKADDTPPGPATGSTHILDVQNVSEYKNMEAGKISNAEVSVDDYFTIYPGDSATLEVDSRTIGDYATSRSIRTGDGLKIRTSGTILAGIKFTTSMPAKVTVYWNTPAANRGVLIKDATDRSDVTSDMLTESGSATSVLELKTAGTYVIGGTADIIICRMDVVEGDGGPRAPWNKVAAPVIDSVTSVNDGASYEVKVTAPVGVNGGDKLTVEMYNEEHFQFGTPQPVKTASNITNTGVNDDGRGFTTFTFTPDSSGSYLFKTSLSRKGEKDKTAEAPDNPYAFKFPLAKPEISTLMNIAEVEDEEGHKTGGITATWKNIKEADYYTLYVKDADGKLIEKDTEGTSMEVSGLTIGKTISVSVTAYRENADGTKDSSLESDAKSIEITGEGPIAYFMDAADFDSLGLLDAGLKLGTEDYFTLAFKNYRYDKDGKNTSIEGKAEVKSAGTGQYIEINKVGSTGISFTVYGTANAVFSVASTGTSNESAFGLVNSEGKLVTGSITGNDKDKNEATPIYASDTENKGESCIAYGTAISNIEYRDLPAGKYTFLSPYTASRDRGGRLHKISVYDSVVMPPRGEWSAVDAPKISNISYAKGESTIKVTASGYVEYNGADSVMVEMLNSKGVVVDSIVKSEESGGTVDNHEDTDLEFVFTPKASDNYSFRANLVRSGEANIPMKDAYKEWTVDNFVLPLATPSVRSMTNMEDGTDSNTETGAKTSGSLEVVFAGVDEADYYVVAALRDTELLATEYVDIDAYKDAEDAEKPVKLASEKTEDKSYTVILKGLPIGNCYVTVQAFRKTGSNSKFKATTMTLNRVPATGNDSKDKIEKKTEDTLTLKFDELKQNDDKGKTDAELREEAIKALKGAAPTDAGFATAVVRSNAFMPSASKYVNGKKAARWSHSVFGSNTTRSKYTRKKALNAFDGEYPATADASVEANNYNEEVYEVTDTDPKPEGKDYGDLKSVTVWSENGRGKVVPASTDGLSYYYTSVNPAENNFTLSALIHVKSWTFSNGQDGFGMMVSDTVGKDGDDGNTWTNCYQLLASKIQYSWVRATVDEAGNKVPGYVTNAPGNGTTIMRYEMKLGVGWNAKEGAKASDVAKINAGTITSPVNFSTSSGTLESSAGEYDNGVGRFSGSYNAVGNAFGKAPDSSVANDADLLTDFRFQIQKYDNAYVLRYLALAPTAADDKVADKRYQEIDGIWYEILGEQVFSDDNNNKLTQIDKNNIYVGFFAARNARIGVSEINLNLTPAGDDDYKIPTITVDPSVTITSMEASNSKNYDLALNANFDGTLTIYKEHNGKKTAVTTAKAITAGTKYKFTTALDEGTTKFTCSAKPNENFVPGENQVLSNKNMQTAEIDVAYNAFKGDTIYVKPNGAYAGTSKKVVKDGEEVECYAGSSDNPTNVYDAVNYAMSGQTIILAGGKYTLTTDAYSNDKKEAANLLIGKKHDGTPKSYITMKAAEDAVGNNRPVLDFGQKTQKNDTAFIIAGNYWHFEGFDVINSKDGQKGILLGGSHNILSDLRTYLNGNTGIQVARYSNDGRSEWPSYNTLINCSSFMNYDSGYEDADGFAAKLTCGDGNKFIGCIAAFNADDGWDLFAKVESGSIGVVTIENCLAFKNGYLFGAAGMGPNGSDLIYRCEDDLSKYNKKTPIVSAGNGNGFKMGGDSMSGYHVLRNSIAFGNKSKGIDSNSCPDIQVYNSISYNNEANNVALYTGAAVNTDYYVENLISIKDSSCANGGASTLENISPKGTQNTNKIYGSKNYFWNGSKSANIDGAVFNTSEFGHMSMNNAIFGAKGTRIDRNDDGSINLHGFLELGAESNIGVGGSNPDDMLDKGADIYVFAAEYCKSNSKLSDIKLSGYDATKSLAQEGYDWVDGSTVFLSSYAGSSVDFTVSNGTRERKVTVNFIQMDGAELQVIDGDKDSDGVLDAGETWTVEAVPVISPAVEPDALAKISGFKAEIKETTRSLLTIGNFANGTVNANLNVDQAHCTVTGKDNTNGSAKMTATISLTAGNRTVKKTAVLAFTVKDKVGIKFDTIEPAPSELSDKVRWEAEKDSDYIQVAMDTMTGQTFTLKNLHFVTPVEKPETDAEGNDTGKTKIEYDPVPFGTGVSIKVNDTSVIKLTKTTKLENGVDATFTVVNRSKDGGTATITVTSKKDKTLVRNYVVTVSGSEFAWTSGTVTIDKAKTEGIQLAALAPFDMSMDKVKNDEKRTDENGNVTVDRGITVAAVYKGTRVTNSPVDRYKNCFVADQVPGVDGVYELNTTADAVKSLPRGTYTVVYQTEVEVEKKEPAVQPQNSEGTSTEKKVMKFTPITIRVTEVRPYVTFRQKKRVNLFYKNGTDGSTGKLIASSKQGAVTVTASENNYFRFSDNGAGYDIVSIKKDPVEVNPRNGAANYRDVSQNRKVELKAHVEGYYEDYDITRNFPVALEYRQPRLKLTALDRTIYTAFGMDGADILIYDPDSEMYLSPDVATIELITDRTDRRAYSSANTQFTVGDITSDANSGNGVRLSVNSATRTGGTVRLSIKYDDWCSDASVIVSQSIRVNKAQPSMTVKPVRLNINTEEFVGKEQVSSSIILTGAKGFDIGSFTLEGTNSKSNELLKFVDYKLSKDVNGNNVLLVSLKEKDKDGKAFPAEVNTRTGVYRMKAGYPSSCSFRVKYKLGSAPEKTTTFRLSLISRERLTVSTKGSINIINRENSAVTFKPRTTNFTPSQVADVKLTGDAANLFTVADFDKSTGVTTIKAKDTADLKRGSYKVYPVYTFDLGVYGTTSMTTERPVIIRTTQSNLKITGLRDVLEVKLSSHETAAQRTITVAPTGAYITELTQTNYLDNFTVTYTGDGVEVVIKDRAGLKEGKTYRITAILNVEGSGSNVRKQQIVIPVKVIR